MDNYFYASKMSKTITFQKISLQILQSFSNFLEDRKNPA